MKKPYYYIPPCPKCNSPVTGRYVKRPIFNSKYVYESSLKNGELIEFKDCEPEKNAFCSECGYEWQVSVHCKMLQTKEIQKEKDLRKTEEQYKEYQKQNTKEKSSIFEKFLKGVFGI